MVTDLVEVWVYSNVGDKEQNVVHCRGPTFNTKYKERKEAS